MRSYENQWIDTDLRADTAIGRQVEALLGIDMNASKLPDYKGIELKSFRSQRPSIKKNLFCKVPDWELSHLKSGAEIVDKYGYMSGGIKSYRNTLYCKAPNSQNLRLNMNYPDDLLEIEEDKIKIISDEEKETMKLINNVMKHEFYKENILLFSEYEKNNEFS